MGTFPKLFVLLHDENTCLQLQHFDKLDMN